MFLGNRNLPFNFRHTLPIPIPLVALKLQDSMCCRLKAYLPLFPGIFMNWFITSSSVRKGEYL